VKHRQDEFMSKSIRSAGIAGLALAIWSCCWSVIAVEPHDPEATAAKLVIRLLETESLKKWPVDDARATQLLKAFVAHLDPQRLYFLQSDWTEFQTHEKSLDNQLREGDLSFVKLVLQRFRTRAREAQKLTTTALQTKHDFTLDETWPFPYDGFAVDQGALAERWRLRIKGELLFERANDSTPAEAVSFLKQRYDNSWLHIQSVTEDRAQEIFLDALCNSIDPHQNYFSPDFLDSMRVIISLRWPKYWSNLRLVPLREGVPHIRGLTLPLAGLAGQEEFIGWDLVAIRAGAATHHLVGACNYEADALRRALVAGGKFSEVILELQHPQTLQRKSLAWTQTKSPDSGGFSYPGPLKPAADDPANKARAEVQKPAQSPPPQQQTIYYPRRHHFRRR
jgi:hypothetical protein